jgi:hypothetical protein
MVERATPTHRIATGVRCGGRFRADARERGERDRRSRARTLLAAAAAVDDGSSPCGPAKSRKNSPLLLLLSISSDSLVV